MIQKERRKAEDEVREGEIQALRRTVASLRRTERELRLKLRVPRGSVLLKLGRDELELLVRAADEALSCWDSCETWNSPQPRHEAVLELCALHAKLSCGLEKEDK